jgi:3-oxoacyl-[acyl-carrier-protein] synthase II
VTRAVAVTGLGVVSALGGNVDALATGLIEGRCGIAPLRLFQHRGRASVAAEVPEDMAGHDVALDPATTRRLSRADRFALVAAEEACLDAGLDATLRRTAALYAGATTAGMRETEEAYRRRRAGEDRRFRVSRMLATPLSTPAAVVSQALGVFGPRGTFSTACSSSALAIAAGVEAILRGRARVVVALGCDQLCRLTYAGFDALQALDPEPCRPFDRDRRGLSLGEGAAALVLEDAAHARARGARVRAVVAGHGTATDAHHVTAPHPDGAGARRALEAALEMADLPAQAVGYVNAHGSGTRHNDEVEITVLRAVFGDRLPHVPVSSTKSQVGHCLAAAGAIEAVATVLALERGVLPPTVNLRAPEPVWTDLDLVPRAGRRASLAVAVTSSSGFGGHNVTLVFTRPGAV